MTVVVDANVLVAMLDVDDTFHRAALARCLDDGDVLALNVTLAEATIYPTRLGVYEDALEVLGSFGVRTTEVNDAVAGRARRLRAMYGNRHFPMVDALVVALGVETQLPVVTCDAKWPTITDAVIERLSARG